VDWHAAWQQTADHAGHYRHHSEREDASWCRPNLPNNPCNGETHTPDCLNASGYGHQPKVGAKEPWPKSERPNGKPGTKVLRLEKKMASRRIK
jgi:hypothetical protein